MMTLKYPSYDLILNRIQSSFKEQSEDSSNLHFYLKDGILKCNRLLFQIWGGLLRKYLNIFDDNEAIIVMMLPDETIETMTKTISVLTTGKITDVVFDDNHIEFLEFFYEYFPDISSSFSKSDFHGQKRSQETKKEDNLNLKEFPNRFKTKDDNVCPICLEYFSRKEARDNHIRSIHLKEDKFDCSVCNASFKTSNGLSRHHMDKHSEGKVVHICETCGTVYQSERHLLRHCKTTGHDFPQGYKERNVPLDFVKCGICFKLVRNLDFHIKKYHNKKDNKIKCDHCDFESTRKDTILKHERLKHGLFNKQFGAIKETFKSEWTCPECRKTMFSIKEVEDHISLKNCKENKCHECGKIFTLRYNLHQHIRNVHTSHETFKCDKCSKVFRHKSSLNKHMKNCNPDAKE